MSTANISLTSQIERAMLYCYNGRLFGSLKNPILSGIEQKVFSRVAGSLISITSAIELVVHTAFLALTSLYVLGKAIYTWSLDITLPWQHLQRMRDTIFPIFFGSLFGIMHSYLGTYAAEPVKKHIAAGILLSRTQKEEFDVVCSPCTAIQESSSLISQLAKTLQGLLDLSKEQKMLNQISFWEREFEKIQSIDFFNFNLTAKVNKHLITKIDTLKLPYLKQELLKRVFVVTYPILMILDLVLSTAISALCLAFIAIKLLGGKAPAYMEQGSSLEVQICNIIKIPLFLISATVGAIVFLFSPKAGIKCTSYPIDFMAKCILKIKMLFIKLKLYMMPKGDVFALPVVHNRDPDPDGSLQFLPSLTSHMRYLMIQKEQDGTCSGELIERGSNHRKTERLSIKEMSNVIDSTLSLRYRYGKDNQPQLSSLYPETDQLRDLGKQYAP